MKACTPFALAAILLTACSSPFGSDDGDPNPDVREGDYTPGNSEEVEFSAYNPSCAIGVEVGISATDTSAWFPVQGFGSIPAIGCPTDQSVNPDCVYLANGAQRVYVPASLSGPDTLATQAINRISGRSTSGTYKLRYRVTRACP